MARPRGVLCTYMVSSAACCIVGAWMVLQQVQVFQLTDYVDPTRRAVGERAGFRQWVTLVSTRTNLVGANLDIHGDGKLPLVKAGKRDAYGWYDDYFTNLYTTSEAFSYADVPSNRLWINVSDVPRSSLCYRYDIVANWNMTIRQLSVVGQPTIVRTYENEPDLGSNYRDSWLFPKTNVLLNVWRRSGDRTRDYHNVWYYECHSEPTLCISRPLQMDLLASERLSIDFEFELEASSRGEGNVLASNVHDSCGASWSSSKNSYMGYALFTPTIAISILSI